MVVGGEEVQKVSRRRAIVELGYYVAEHGDPDGPVAAAVTEGRIESAYSHGWGTSCVELPDCLAFAAGARCEAINRSENGGRHEQRDLGWFLPGSKHEASIIQNPRLEQLLPGFFLGYDFDRGGHACVFLGMLPDGRVLTADYGQTGGGGKLYQCAVGQDAHGRVTFRGRSLFAAVDTNTLVYTEPALTVGEWCEAHGLPIEPWTPFEYL